MSYVQLLTQRDCAEMFSRQGTARVVSVDYFRHAGDHDNGEQDSWFIQAYVALNSANGVGIVTPVSLRSTSQHGISIDRVIPLITAIEAQGFINLHLWNFSNESH